MARYTEISVSSSLRPLVERCARGVYQRALLGGREAWSGATLIGTAAAYGYWYARSRRNLIARLSRLTAHGITVREERRAYGRRVVVIEETQS